MSELCENKCSLEGGGSVEKNADELFRSIGSSQSFVLYGGSDIFPAGLS